MIIGITGGTGCGKTTALEAARALGGLVLDCDAIYHRLLAEDKKLLDAIEARFPGVVEDGCLQRKKLGEIVFSDKAALLDLNKITHAAVKQEVLRQLQGHTGLAVIDAIGLFEGELNSLCDLTVAVTAPEEIRVQRLVRREGISEEYARARIAAQRSNAEFSQLCDYTLENDTTRDDFQRKCLAFFEPYSIIKETNFTEDEVK